MKILIGYDGSECAESALSDLKRGGMPAVMEAHVVCVADEWPSYALAGFEAVEAGDGETNRRPVVGEVPDSHQTVLQGAVQVAQRGADSLQTMFPGWKITAEGFSGSPYSTLISLAEEKSYDLLVVGSHGRTFLGRALLGSVSHFAVNHARCSVRVSRCPLFQRESPVRLVIGVDGSPHSKAAVRAMGRREWPQGSQAKVLMAMDTKYLNIVPGNEYPAPQWLDYVDKEVRENMDTAAAEASSALSKAGLAVQTVLRDGDPRTVLLEEAEAWQADLLVIGARGHGALERFLIGSVSSALAARAHCTVEIIRPDSANAGELT